MKTIYVVAYDKKGQLVFKEVEENKWLEELWLKDINEQGEEEWYCQHTVEWLTKKAVDSFIEKAEEAGWKAI